MTTSIIVLLQLALSLLVTVQNSPTLPAAAKERALSVAAGAVQTARFSLQNAAPKEPPKEDKTSSPLSISSVSISPSQFLNANQISNMDYKDAAGNTVTLTAGQYVGNSESVNLIVGDTSFGDLNGDNFDDAVTVLETVSASGPADYALAVILNRNGVPQYAAGLDLGTGVTIYSHRTGYGQYTIDFSSAAQPEKTHVFKLVGNSLREVSP